MLILLPAIQYSSSGTCGATEVTTGPTQTGSYSGNYPVYEETGTFTITATQKHTDLTFGGGTEAPVGQLYQCAGKLNGGWGVNQASCCTCSRDIEPTEATRSLSYASEGTS